MKSRSVSITGATGFYGGHVATAFLRAGWHVRGIARPGRNKAVPEGVERFEVPLEKAALTKVIAGSDVIVHAAAIARARDEIKLTDVNVGGTRAIVEAANTVGSRIVLISSQAAAGIGTAAHPARENDQPRPLTAYGRSKLAQEEVVRTHARVPWTILRPSAIYGPRDRQFLPLFRMAQRGVFLLAAHPATAFTLIDVRDAAAAVVTAAGHPAAPGRTFFLGHPDPQSASAVLSNLGDIVGRPGTLRRVPATVLWLAAAGGEVAWRLGRVPLIDFARLKELRADGFVCSVDRIRDELGFTAATPLRSGLESTWRWYREQGWV